MMVAKVGLPDFEVHVVCLRGKLLNALAQGVYRSPMFRSLTLLLHLACGLGAQAQPLTDHDDFNVHFFFYVDGEKMPAIELCKDRRFTWTLDGAQQLPAVDRSSGLLDLRFTGRHGDRHFYKDTLWMDIDRGSARMSIAFPPREGPGHTYYTAHGMRVDFRPGRFVITDFPKELHLRGTLQGLVLTNGVPAFALIASAQYGCSGPSGFNTRIGLLNADIPCSTYHEDGMEWVRFDLIQRSMDREDTMHVRCQYRSKLDLDGLEWIPGHYLWLFGKQRLDRTFPVGEFLSGNETGTRFRILPIEPFDDERMTIELKWQGRELPIRSWFHTVQRPDGITEIRFQLAGSTVGVVPTEVKEQRLTLNISTFPVGRYVVTQEKRPGGRLRQIDILMGREVAFEVREWK